MREKRASVLMIALWILAILVIFAVGMGRRAAISLKLAKYQRDRLKANYLAEAALAEATAKISNEPLVNNESLSAIQAQGQVGIYRLADEERKLNLNRSDTLGQAQLLGTFRFIGLEEASAQELRDTLMEWIDAAVEPEEEKKIFKNGPLKAPEELLVVLEYFYQKNRDPQYQLSAQEAYGKLKDLVTVYTDNKININTVSSDVLGILMDALAETEAERSNSLKLKNAILALREEKKFFSELSDMDDAATSEGEAALLARLKENLKLSSNLIKIEATASAGNISRSITVVFNRNDNGILYWRQY